MKPQLEDSFIDIISKAQRGRGISDEMLASQIGFTDVHALTKLKNNSQYADAQELKKIANVLQLNPDALADSAYQKWFPEEPKTPETFAQVTTDYHGMLVNSYLVWDATKNAIAFDTGANADEMNKLMQKHQLRLAGVFITHTHDDHIAALRDLTEYTRARIHVPREEIAQFESYRPIPVDDGYKVTIGTMKVNARLTCGHSPGGMTYVVQGEFSPPSLAMVGDALFAGSQGGVDQAHYERACQLNREQILSLPADTIICPGHGPLCTVGEQAEHNPFYLF